MTSYRRDGKCPKCCPDQPWAIFTREWKQAPTTGEWRWCWVCTNCSQQLPYRPRAMPAADHRTPSQRRWLDRIARDFGGTIEVTRHGRSIFVRARNDDRHLVAEGTSLYGTISDGGAVKLTLGRLFGDAEITSLNKFEVYVPRMKKEA